MVNLGKFLLKCPSCGGSKLTQSEDSNVAGGATITCPDCGYTASAQALIDQNLNAALEAAKKPALDVAADMLREALKKR